MKYLETRHEKKSFAITVTIHVLLILLLLFLGLKYLDPPPESGIAINFGTSDVGSGIEQPTEPVASAPQTSSPEVAPVETSINEEVVTQEVEEAPVIEKKEEEKVVEAEEPVQKEEVIPVKKPDPKPDKSTTDALSSILNGPEKEGEATSGEGDDNLAGDKGDPDGDPNADAYYGNGLGLDGDGNYLLGGRKALNKEKFVQDCNEAGIVVVQIEVDRNGRVINARPGVKGSTNTAECLTSPAKRAALATTFNSDPNAPARQVGTIIYNFKLSE